MLTRTPTETDRLLQAWCEERDADARARLIEQHLPLVRTLARRFSHRSEQLDDLAQVGALGLIKA
ncbi:MAG: RNA polymerase sigma factor SigF, partial [Thermoleophilaceae bacterium]|nr:RNA polymerase sigma factor SigF [Thermoleophilaceae bacterium]